MKNFLKNHKNTKKIYYRTHILIYKDEILSWKIIKFSKHHVKRSNTTYINMENHRVNSKMYTNLYKSNKKLNILDELHRNKQWKNMDILLKIKNHEMKNHKRPKS